MTAVAIIFLVTFGLTIPLQMERIKEHGSDPRPYGATLVLASLTSTAAAIILAVAQL